MKTQEDGSLVLYDDEFHIEWIKTETAEKTKFNVFDVAADICDRIMEG